MSKVYDGLIGLAVGDALGVPFEFKERDTFFADGMWGNGTHNQPIGTWSDDTSMTIATMEAIITKKRIDLETIMNNFVEWYYNAKFTAYDNRFDCGNTTAQAILNYNSRHKNVDNCGIDSEYANGNGSLMRILPLAYIDCGDYYIDKVSALTHAHYIARNGCAVYVYIARALLNGIDKREAVQTVYKLGNVDYRRLGKIESYERDFIKSSGYVIDTLEAAVWCLLTTDNYKDCILKAVNLGEDTDTVAAVVGGLAGILYGVGGEKGVPEEWIAQLAKKDYFEDLAKRFEEVLPELNEHYKD